MQLKNSFMLIRSLLLFTGLVTGLAIGPFTGQAWAKENLAPMKEDRTHVHTWNKFAEDLLALHKQRVSRNKVRTTEKAGGYMNNPDFYKEVEYIDVKTGKLLSRVLWEKDNPDQVHVMEVYFYDAKGKPTRDFTAAFLPGYRNAPNQTLINLHGTHPQLKAFRSFDASGDRIYEQCEGSLGGKEVWISMEDYQIEYELRQGSKGVMGTAEYKSCFKGVSEDPGKYLTPQ